MKHLITSAAFALGLVYTLPCASQTTLEEYNYLTKGYKMQLEGGLDMKKGYYMVDMGETRTEYNSFARVTEIKLLCREKDSLICATLMIVKRTDTDFLKYVCVPMANSSDDIWNKAQSDYWAAMYDWDEAAKAFSWNSLKYISAFTEMLNTIEQRVGTLPPAERKKFKDLFKE